MAIESKATKTNGPSDNYPCLMESGTKVVLFTEPCKGTVVWCDSGVHHNYEIGYYAEDWVMYFFSPFDGVVDLKNKE